MNLLASINNPRDLKKLSLEELPELAAELRREIIDTVSKVGGHLASNLGVVELIIALHYVLDTPKDKIVFDVGHQAYAHKLLTGRKSRFATLRQWQGISGFPSRAESEYDTFTVGHGSTSISTALGLACADGGHKTVAFIGDASLGGGMALEGLNHAGQLKKDLIVILNDNKMAISKSVGALSHYLNRIITMPVYNRIRKDVESLIQKVPRFGSALTALARRLEEGLKNLLVPGMLFEELGFRYFGPIDGHNIEEITRTLKNVLRLEGPILVHAVTTKGKGDLKAQTTPEKFHGVSSLRAVSSTNQRTFTKVFSDKLINLAEQNDKIVAITAAMPEGTGLDAFASRFPNRFYDVGMAEEHAVGFAAGLAAQGLRPVVAIYSTFLQRAYDQIIQEVCLQNLPVVFCLDHCGIVGADGATHQGTMDLVYLRSIPNLTILAPADGQELESMLEFALKQIRPIAIRYPKAVALDKTELMPAGYASAEICQNRCEVLSPGRDLAVIALGSMVYPSLKAAQILRAEGIEAEIINARFAKPLDLDLLRELCARFKLIVTVEEGIADGGFGSSILEFLEQENLIGSLVKRIALPLEFITHAKREQLLQYYGLDAQGIVNTILRVYRLNQSKTQKIK